MRGSAVLLLGYGLLAFLPPIVFADTLDLGKTCQNVTAVTDTTASADQAALAKICADQAKVECSLNNESGCEKYTRNTGTLPNTNFANATTKAIALQMEAQVVPKLNDFKSKADECCKSGTNCPLDADSTAAQTRIGSTSADTTGANQSASVLATSLGDSVTVNAYQAGSCRAYRSVCSKSYKAMSDSVAKAKCSSLPLTNADNCQDYAIDKKDLWNDLSKECADIDSTAAETKTITLNQQAQQAGQTTLSTQSATPGSGASQASGGNGQSAPRERTAGGGGDGSGSSSGGSGSGGGMGSSMSSMLPMMMMAMQMMAQQNANSGSSAAPTSTSADCSSNPALAGCTATAGSPATWNTQTGQAGMQPESKATGSGGSFGLGSNSDTYKPANAGIDATSGSNSPITTHGVSNGGGGMMGGGSSTGGVAGAAGGARGAAGSSTSTDILHGEGGGGSSLASLNQGLNTQTASGGGGSFGGNNNAGNDGLGVGLQLADFLPGGKKDPARGIASVSTGSPEIQAKTVNIWSRISEHIRSRCAQGLLRDCGPQ